ncbi:hypothetical protein QM588_04030 [Rhodococcus sp. IEGM 1354]|uniref:hypothetical protein n=1 Tax=Rhodococcus sp. IEGM 1354 TaxID=3047088 RepID=UPI001C90A876|nr:hypothetical protein [Rhodococcus sp. IEGM 1354]MBY4403904.1 hypothetical protein [Rhodococcus fascians]MBY4417465.1 hypothetical protein [Rhodococcus fascians]MDI9929566.1 hypothetical protein [Rhodococcus sp. IEGM 1354]
MSDLDTEYRSARIDYERKLMRSPLAAQLRVVEQLMRLMMAEQGVLHPRDLVASALPPNRHPTLNSA